MSYIIEYFLCVTAAVSSTIQFPYGRFNLFSFVQQITLQILAAQIARQCSNSR